MIYPNAKKVDQTDDYHGTSVADPYRWLEESDTPETTAWISAQNKLSTDYLNELPHVAPLRERLQELWNYTRRSTPIKRGDHIFFVKNDGLQNQGVLYRQKADETEPEVLLDPNALSTDGTVALHDFSASEDGRLLAYALTSAGSDWIEFRVRDVETGRDLDDVIRWAKFTMISWTHDGRGFFYSRYPEPGASGTYQQANRNHRLCYHRLGTPQSEDITVFEMPDHPRRLIFGSVSDDGGALLVEVGEAGPQNLLYLIDLGDPQSPVFDGKVVPVVEQFEAQYHYIGNDGERFFLLTTSDAPRGRVLMFEKGRPEQKEWKELIPEGDDVISSARVAGGRLVIGAMHQAQSVLRLYHTSGTYLKDIPLPGLGSVIGVSGRSDDPELFLNFTSFFQPGTLLSYNVENGGQEVIYSSDPAFDPDDFISEQVWYQSRDGTQVPMFLTYRKGLQRNGENPVLLYGYGGFNVSLTPTFSPASILWMENGGIYAVANLRGGGEFGEEWHRAGTREKKQNVFDDFIAAAEYLIDNGFTRPGKLALRGGSNGGLLVGAVLCQRPDLFAVALPEVGVLDMLRYHLFTIGSAWASDYGTSDDPEHFQVLHSYSPLHNLKPDGNYPATLIMTGDHDDRVVPAHSFKFAARLQECQQGEPPVLIRITTNAGHGHGKPMSMIINEIADLYAFTMKNLDMPVPEYASRCRQQEHVNEPSL